MGYGDQLMATGMARGALARGRKIAFGDGRKILWDKHSEEMFRGNLNIARPGAERDENVDWAAYYKGHRIYNRQDPGGRRWLWNLDFRPIPGEVIFDRNEVRNSARFGKGFVVIEPNVVPWKSVAPNKDWGLARYQAVADALKAHGHRVVQVRDGKTGERLAGVEQLRTLGFRDALAILRHARLFVGPEGGLHHGAAAVGIPAVVLFGGFIPPQVTGYPGHANLTGGAQACGSYTRCQHCIDALAAISADEVLAAALERL